MIFYRIGCYILIATCLIHLYGHFREHLPQNEIEKQLLDLMTNYIITLGTATFTLQNLQNGLSLCYSLMFLWTGVLCLYLSYPLANNLKVLRNVSLINTIALTIGSSISVIYFFWAPTSSFVLALAFSIAGTIMLGRKQRDQFLKRV